MCVCSSNVFVSGSVYSWYIVVIIMTVVTVVVVVMVVVVMVAAGVPGRSQLVTSCHRIRLSSW